MGIANVIPGVSGGTIALVTNIYEKLIISLKSFDRQALKLLLSMQLSKLVEYTNFYFLLSVFSGSIFSVFSIANLFKYLFDNYPIMIWAFFFGLILASIYYIGKRIKEWNITNIISLLVGVIIAISVTLLEPATENDNLLFVFICGIIGIMGMILPGLSGSFILIMLGNYELLLVTAIVNLNYTLLIYFFLGSVFGLLAFSHFIAWLLKKYRDQTLAILTGFVIGSLYIIWPWKEIVDSVVIEGEKKMLSYKYYLPNILILENIISFILIISGVILVYFLENIPLYNKKR